MKQNKLINHIKTKNLDPDILKKNYNHEIFESWKHRTNEPYKNILKDLDYKKEIKTSTDLIVHKVTEKDKNGLQDDYNVLKTKLDVQNGEIKNTYSMDKQTHHRKIFEIENKYKFRVFTTSDITENSKEYFKNEKQVNENNKITIDKINTEL